MVDEHYSMIVSAYVSSYASERLGGFLARAFEFPHSPIYRQNLEGNPLPKYSFAYWATPNLFDAKPLRAPAYLQAASPAFPWIVFYAWLDKVENDMTRESFLFNPILKYFMAGASGVISMYILSSLNENKRAINGYNRGTAIVSSYSNTDRFKAQWFRTNSMKHFLFSSILIGSYHLYSERELPLDFKRDGSAFYLISLAATFVSYPVSVLVHTLELESSKRSIPITNAWIWQRFREGKLDLTFSELMKGATIKVMKWTAFLSVFHRIRGPITQKIRGIPDGSSYDARRF